MKQQLMFWSCALLGLLFLRGYEFAIGIGGSEPSIIPIPKNQLVGWLFVSFALIWCFPPWLISKVIRFTKRLIKGKQIDAIAYKKRIDKAEKTN